ncbi:MAG: FAD-binding oxidoreductase [Pigmentiphaga sp.]|nr:FAD-binding oxidoreductase [Pigmentiphaga sp.]
MTEALLARWRRTLGAAHVLNGEDAEPYLLDHRGRYHGRALAVVFPDSTETVAQVVRDCVAQRLPMVPQGGNTGLVGGGIPDPRAPAVVINLRRCQRIRKLDPANNTLTLEAGCTLARAQQAAREIDRLYPLSLASEGSATIGGNLATNAGGTQVLRYGNTRELVLGLEVVTAQGDIWNGLRGLRKDNTGYDLKQLYIGSEGTLGIITAACLKLFAPTPTQHAALLAVPDMAGCIALLERLEQVFGPQLTAFEVMSAASLDVVRQSFPDLRAPLAQAPWQCLIEVSSALDPAQQGAALEAALATLLEQGRIQDAVIAQSVAEFERLWAIRESISDAQRKQGKNLKHDISLPRSEMVRFIEHCQQRLRERLPGLIFITFGHLGDGNLHYNLTRPAHLSEADFLAQQAALAEIVHDEVHAHQGSISAEHGIGQLKRDVLPRYKSDVELGLMKQIKQALDPLNLMNPGKVLP